MIPRFEVVQILPTLFGRTGPNGTAGQVTWLHNKRSWLAAGLDAHSLFNVDPLLLNADFVDAVPTNLHWPFGLKLGPDSPAFGLGFHNFDYGPRQTIASKP